MSDKIQRLYELLNVRSYPANKQMEELLNKMTVSEKLDMFKNEYILFQAAGQGEADTVTVLMLSVPQRHRVDILKNVERDPWSFPVLHHTKFHNQAECVEAILNQLTPEQQLEALSMRCRMYEDTPIERVTNASVVISGSYYKENPPSELTKLMLRYQQRAKEQLHGK